MCGFCGIVNVDQSDVQRRDLQIMTDKMYARGPDSDGYYCEGNVGFGFRRLAIIDLESGDQPLSNEDNSIWLVMNGEIYNYLELRSELLLQGHLFKTKSDAEVILHLYEEYGSKCIERLNGMFAFALYDQKKGRILIARDKLGIKPLYYKITDKQIVFGSDAKSIVLALNEPIDADEGSFLSYLSHSYTTTKSIFKGVLKLDPGTYMEIKNKEFKIFRYWSVKEFSNNNDSMKAIEDNLSILLLDSVKLQLQSDVPLGIFLSGGVDSSAIVAYASQISNKRIHTYTVEYVGKKANDPKYALEVSKRYNTIHTSLLISNKDAEGYLNELLTVLDEPIADSAIIATYALAKRASLDGVKVLLSGAGGDEIFGGYKRHIKPKKGSRHWVRDTVLRNNNVLVGSFIKKINPKLHNRMGNDSLNYSAQISGIDYSIVKKLLSEKRYEQLVSQIKKEYSSIKLESKIGYSYSRMHNDLNNYLVNNILALTDKATMAASVEARVPLLDHRIVEYAFNLRSRVNMLSGEGKGLFKSVLKKLLPKSLLFRKKEGFNAPVKNWVMGKSREKIKTELLENASKPIKEFLDMQELEILICEETISESGYETIFALYVFNKWWNANF
jgi:asparagine synthase (glutamine-hydrolysing)